MAKLTYTLIPGGKPKYSRADVQAFSEELYDSIKHGNRRHRLWLMRRINQFTAQYLRRKARSERKGK